MSYIQDCDWCGEGAICEPYRIGNKVIYLCDDCHPDAPHPSDDCEPPKQAPGGDKSH